MFHDLGLTERYRDSTLRFEVDGANAAREFLTAHGVEPDRRRQGVAGIALHTTPGVPEFLAPEVALVHAGVELDVLGIGRDDLAPDEACRGDRRPPAARFQTPDPRSVHRRYEAAAAGHGRHDERRCARTISTGVRPRRLRRQDPQERLA